MKIWRGKTWDIWSSVVMSGRQRVDTRGWVILPVSLQPDPCVMSDEGIDTALQMLLASHPWTDIARKGFQDLQAGDEMLGGWNNLVISLTWTRLRTQNAHHYVSRLSLRRFCCKILFCISCHKSFAALIFGLLWKETLVFTAALFSSQFIAVNEYWQWQPKPTSIRDSWGVYKGLI